MRKQTKIAAVVSATALLAIGASFTSMAATYDWRVDEAGESVCYDADGDLYEEAWVEYAGDKYFMDEDGHIVKDSWIEGDDDDLYFVDEEGKMIKNNWMETIEYDADEDADELDWFYFGANGKLTKSKRISWNDTYYFVDEAGKMLTGWVEYSKPTVDGKTVSIVKAATTATEAKHLIYTNEDGTIAASMWLNDFGPGYTDEELEKFEEEDLNWYYIKADGYVQTGKAADINGETYFFGHKEGTQGELLTGWVKKSGSVYTEFTGTIGEGVTYKNLFFCGGKDEGWMKKDQWTKQADPEHFSEEDPANTYWYWIDKSGYVFVPNKATVANAVEFTNGEGAATVEDCEDIVGLLTPTTSNAVKAQELEVNKKTYLFKENGTMMHGLVKLGADQDMFYYGEKTDGAKKTGVQQVKDSYDDYYTMNFATNTKNGEKVGEAITGTDGKKLYVNGILQKSSDDELYKVVVVNDKEYIVDENGTVQSSTTKKYEFENKEGIFKIKDFAGKDRTNNYVKDAAAWDAQ